MKKEIHIYLTHDKMSAYLNERDFQDSSFDHESLVESLENYGVKFGIKDEILSKMPLIQFNDERCIIAEGKLPKYKIESELVWYVETHKPNLPTINESGRADYKMLHQFEEVKKGQELVSVVPPTLIETGMTVTGEIVDFKDISSEITIGNNIQKTEDGLTLKSTMDGYVFWKDGVMHVDNMYQIRGNVDYHTGNIKFNGKIIIGGDVKSGFRVEATDDIYIQGNVEAANIFSKNGDIIIQAGVLGKKKARLLAGGCIRCGYIQDATVSVKKDVVAEKYIINSTITSGGSIIVDQNEGIIRGGSLSANKKFITNEVGSEKGINTDLMIVENHDNGKSQEQLNVSKQQRDVEKKLSILLKRKEFLTLLKERLPNLSDEKIKELKLLKQKIEKLKQSNILNPEKSTIEKEKSFNQVRENEIVVNGYLHPKVTISFGYNQYFVTKRLKSVVLYKEGNEILIHSKYKDEGIIG